MRAELGCLGGRSRSVREHRLTVSRCFGMVCEPAQVRLAQRRLRERGERAPVQRECLVRRDRLLHDEPRKLVPERDRIVLRPEHAGP